MEPPKHQHNLLYEHPLTNHLILEQVFIFLNHSASIEDWKNVRLVCKLWHDETLARWRSTAVLSFVRDQTIFDPPLPKKTTPLAFLTELQNPDSLYKLREVPYQRYKFTGITIDLPHNAGNKLGALFWNLVGPCIKHLTLKKLKLLFRDKDPSVRANIVNFLVEATPNLETLTLDHVHKDGASYSMTNVHPKLTALHWINSEECDLELASFPSLQDVVFTNCDDMDFYEMIGGNRNPSDDLGHSGVRRLDLMESKLGDAHLFIVSNSKLRFPLLEQFSVHLFTQRLVNHSEDDDVPLLPKFVRNHCQTLKTLEVFTSVDKAPPELCPLSAKLPALTELRLWGNVVKNLGFLRFTPNLKLLHLDLYGEEKRQKMIKTLKENAWQWGTIANGAHVNYGILRSTVESGNVDGVVLNKLEYFQLNCSLSPEDVENLSDWMPNLKTLKAVLNAKTISAVCHKWPRLEHLVCLFGSLVEDRVITGNSMGNELKALVDFKCLKSFEYNADCNTSTLTDESVVNGFLKMAELTRLQICVSSKFTEEAKQMLFERVQNVKVLKNYPGNEEHTRWECCKNATFKQFIADFDTRNYADDEFSSDSSMSSSLDGSISAGSENSRGTESDSSMSEDDA